MDEKSLAFEILRHKKLYYEGRPEISDEDFDLLEERLRAINPAHPALQVVGAANVMADKLPHQKKMLSLQKVYTATELLAWIKNYDVVMLPKIDGVSGSILYRDGKFYAAKTRGDGSQGENISAKVHWCPGIPKRLNGNPPNDIEIRGEFFCTDNQFLQLTQAMLDRKLPKPSSARNIVAGLFGRKDHSDLCQFLSFLAFDCLQGEINLNSELEKFALMEGLGFKIPPISHFVCHQEILTAIQNLQSYPFAVDGLVFSFNQLSIHDELGETSHHPRYKMAFKFDGEHKETKVKDIVWQVSRTGALTPVALLEPVLISGALIERVSVHNVSILRELNLVPGSVVLIKRSGEVIPKIVEVKNSPEGVSMNIPSFCPSCKFPLVENDTKLICTSNICKAKKVEQIIYFVECLNIEDLSEKRIQELVQLELLKDEASLFELEIKDLLQLSNTKEKLAKKLYDNIQAKKNIPLSVFFTSLGLTNLGPTKIEKIIAKGYTSVASILSLDLETLVAIEGFAEKTAGDFLRSIDERKALIERLVQVGIQVIAATITTTGSNSVLSGKKFCITGTLTRKRSEVEQYLKSLGAEIAGSVSKNTDFLITNETDGESAKFIKAKELGIPIITEDELYHLQENSK